MKVKIPFIEDDFLIPDLNHQAWEKAVDINVKKYWSGETAPVGRRFKTKFLWSKTAFYARFVANQAEPMVISKTPNLITKTLGLWERDVCEVFLAPNPGDFRKYFEFEVAPTGEWIDLEVHQQIEERITDWDYDSEIETAAKIEKNKVWIAFKVEWEALGKTPQAGEIWKGNILRCVGEGKNRGYLTWSPTLTEKPNFHVPEKFGEFEFVK